MPDPLRSPKQSRTAAKNRSHPYSRPPSSHRARDVGLSRSSSLLGTIKSFVTAPLSWLSLKDSQKASDSPQKRRVSNSERDGSPPRAKRPRHESPEVAGYLDPPASLFPPAKPSVPLWNHANGVPLTRTMSIDPIPLSTEPAIVPLPPSRGHSILSQTSMSVEPEVSLGPRRSSTRDLSMPPLSPFARSYARSSLTPQPSGATFGPSPKRKPRESTAPPLLSSPAPAFIRPPSLTDGKQGISPRAPSREISDNPISVLLGRGKQSMSPLKEAPSRNLLVRDENVPNRESPSFRHRQPITDPTSGPGKNVVQQTISVLESFRTPLHMSRFPCTPPAERPRKVHVPIPSKLRFDHTVEGRKEKTKRGPAVVGPYSTGMSGMRKLLARRREEELERNVGDDVGADHEEYKVPESTTDEGKKKEDEVKETETFKTQPRLNGFVAQVDSPLPRTRSPPRSKNDSPYSSLRAPSSRVSRTHAPAPRLKKAKNKFSLDDDEDKESNLSVEYVKNYQAQAAQAQPTILFSQSRNMSETGMQTDTDIIPPLPRAKSPTLPAQPQTFDSLLSRIGPPTSTASKPTVVFPDTLVSPSSSDVGPQPQLKEATATSSAPATLPFSFGRTSSVPKLVDAGTSPFMSNKTTPTSSPPPVLAPAPSTSEPGSVPSFFANTKAQFTPPKIPTNILFGGIPSKKEADNSDKGDLREETKPLPFGEVNKPSIFGGSSTPVDSPKVEDAKGSVSNGTAYPFYGFGDVATGAPDEGSRPASSFSTPTGGETATFNSGINIFGAPSKPYVVSSSSVIDTSSKRAFSFPATPLSSTPSVEKAEVSSEVPTASASAKRAFSFDARPETSTAPGVSLNSQFSFGASVSTPLSRAAPEASKPPFTFGAAPSTPPPAEKKPLFQFGNPPNAGVSGFSFGSGVSASAVTDTSKPAFVGFGSTTPDSVPKESSADTGDGMEMNGDKMEESPSRTVDKKDIPTSQLPQTTLFTGFGAGNSSSSGFPFGQDKPASSTSGFSFGQHKPQTVFSFGQNTDKPAADTSSGTGFSFGQGANKTATNMGTGFSFGTDMSKPAVPSQLSFGTTLNNPFSGPGFSFGQSNTATNANPFSQPQQPKNGTLSLPNSPSLFPQQPPQPTQTPSPSFSFSVPATSSFPPTNGTAPSTSATPFQFGPSGNLQQPQPPTTTGGGTMFTLGGAATPPRKVKGLPSRRPKRP